MNKPSTHLDVGALLFPLFERIDETEKRSDIFITRSEWPDDSLLINKWKQDVSRFWILGSRISKNFSPNQPGGIGWRKYAAIIFVVGAIALIILLIVDDKKTGTEPEWMVTNKNEIRSLPQGYEMRSEFYTLNNRFIDKFVASCETEFLCTNGKSYSVSIPYFDETVNLAHLHLFTFESGRWILVKSSLIDESQKRLLASVRLPKLRNMVLLEQTGLAKSISFYRSSGPALTR